MFERDRKYVKSDVDCVKDFSKFAGTNLNMDKCKGIWLGNLKNDDEHEMYGISFTNEPVKCLGIFIGHNKEECHNKNWNDPLSNLENVFKSCKQRRLTLFGKVIIIKSLALSKLVYRFSLLHVPEDIIKKVKKLCFDLIWNKTERVKRNVLYNEVQHGGIYMIDIDSYITAIKAAWVNKFVQHPKYFNVLEECISKEIGLSITQMLKTNFRNLKSCITAAKLPIFYQDIFIAFNKCKSIKNLENMNDHDFLT